MFAINYSYAMRDYHAELLYRADAPSGPVDQALANIQFGQITGGKSGARGLDPNVIAEIKKRYGFDKPIWQRYGEMH